MADKDYRADRRELEFRGTDLAERQFIADSILDGAALIGRMIEDKSRRAETPVRHETANPSKVGA